MEKGSLPVEYQGKSLAEINFVEENEYPEENEDGKRFIREYNINFYVRRHRK